MNAQSIAPPEPSTPNVSLRPPQLQDPRGIVLLFCFVLCLFLFCVCLLCYALHFFLVQEKRTHTHIHAAFRVPCDRMTLNFLSLFFAFLCLQTSFFLLPYTSHILHIWMHVVFRLCVCVQMMMIMTHFADDHPFKRFFGCLLPVSSC